MRAFECIVDKIPISVPIEQCYGAVCREQKTSYDFFRMPTSFAVQQSVVEVWGKAATFCPALCYWALPDGLYVGIGAIFRVSTATFTDRPPLPYGTFHPVSSTIFSWQKLSLGWQALEVTVWRLGKKKHAISQQFLSDLLTPVEGFEKLKDFYPQLSLPGSLIMIQIGNLFHEAQSNDAFEVSLNYSPEEAPLFHRYEVDCLF